MVSTIHSRQSLYRPIEDFQTNFSIQRRPQKDQQIKYWQKFKLWVNKKQDSNKRVHWFALLFAHVPHVRIFMHAQCSQIKETIFIHNTEWRWKHFIFNVLVSIYNVLATKNSYYWHSADYKSWFNHSVVFSRNLNFYHNIFKFSNRRFFTHALSLPV